MKITLLFLLIALIAITTLVKADVDEDFDLDAPETGIAAGIEERELWPWYYYKKNGDGKSHARAYAFICYKQLLIARESSILLARRFGGRF